MVPACGCLMLWVNCVQPRATTLPEKLADGGIALHPDDLPWPSGTVVFETPLFVVPEEFVDAGTDEGPIDVMQWVTYTDANGDTGVVVIFWQSRSRSEDPTSLLPPSGLGQHGRCRLVIPCPSKRP